MESLPKRRKQLRLKGYDYSQAGAYFVTICAKDRKHLFGRILGQTMEANTYGRIVEASWRDIPNHDRGVELDEFILMPNHIHGIIVILDDFPTVGAGSEPAIRDSPSIPFVHGQRVLSDPKPSYEKPPLLLGEGQGEVSRSIALAAGCSLSGSGV